MDKYNDFTFDFVNFTADKVSNISTNKQKVKTDTNEYDSITNEHYRIMRLYKHDPIMNDPIPAHLLFEFKYKWNPFNGERTTIDENGPLCFNALHLYEYYFKNRYNGLWNPPVDQFQGYYGDLVGSSPDININSRGSNPEKYLYRIPIIDCYLKKNHNHSIITMGPKLNDDEIKLIDGLLANCKKSISLSTMKEYYDNAINDKPNIMDLQDKYPALTDKELGEKYNRSWVDKLVKLG